MATIEEFGQKIKEKYPQYNHIDNAELGRKMLEKYPQYQSRVFDTDPQVQQQIAQSSQPTRGVWDAIKKGGQNISQTIKETGEELSDTMAAPVSGFKGKVLKTVKGASGIASGIAQAAIAEPIATGLRVGGEVVENATGYDINEATAEKTRQVGELVQKGLDTETAQNVINKWEQFKKDNPDSALASSALGDIGELLSYVVGYKGAKGTINKSRTLRNIVRNEADELVTGAKQTTKNALTKAKPMAEDAVTSAYSRAYGIQPDDVKNILKNPELFTEKEMAKITRESTFNKVKTAVDQRLDELSETGKGYDEIRNLEKSVYVEPNKVGDVLNKYKIEFDNNGKLVQTAESLPMSSADRKALQEFLDIYYTGDGYMSPNAFLNARKALDNMAGYGDGKTGAVKTMKMELRSTLDKMGKEQLPELAALDAKYAPERELLNNVKKTIFNNDGTIKDNAISQVANLTGKGKEQKLARLEKIVPGITEDVNILKTVESIRAAQGNVVGTYGRAALGAVSGGIAGGPVGTVLGMIATSPSVGVAMLRQFAKIKNIPKNKVNGIINKMKSGTKLAKDEMAVVNNAIDNAAQKLKDRAKNIRPGMNTEDLTKNPKILKALERTGAKGSFADFITNLGGVNSHFVKQFGEKNLLRIFDQGAEIIWKKATTGWGKRVPGFNEETLKMMRPLTQDDEWEVLNKVVDDKIASIKNKRQLKKAAIEAMNKTESIKDSMYIAKKAGLSFKEWYKKAKAKGNEKVMLEMWNEN